ncbi:DUF6600 domain-containing protein [Prosthecobacter sp.]|uniref:DUF6600 domain-containing protein n=1 Tax=Prosthecobacter sp. TaxID=1965333 RepID=UPI0037841D40
MKRTLLLLCATLIAVAAPLPQARADDSVPVDFFYDALSPYGDWIYTPNYGYVWEPLASQQPGWSPYADGNWVYTDAGWTWMSNEDFGWLTYHYGRWIRMQHHWFWVPGYEWAPAWVSWRQTQNQIGWAPLPPEAAWVPNIGFGGWTDSYYDVGPAYYNFVPFTAFASRTSLRPFILDRSRNFGFYDQSVNITNTSFRQNAMSQVFVGGPDPQRIDGLGGNQVRRLTLRRDDDGFRREWLEHRNGGPNGGPPHRGMGNPARVEQDQLVIAAPSIRRDASSHMFPSKVREAFQQPEIDRGWHGGKGAQNAEELRKKQRDELARMRPPTLPEKNIQPATAAVPPPAFGRALEPHERSGRGGGVPPAVVPPGGDPRNPTEEVRPAKPISGDAPPGIPKKKIDEPGNGGIVPQPGLTPRGRRGGNQQPGMRPGESKPPPTDEGPRKRPGSPQVIPGNQAPSTSPPNPPKESPPRPSVPENTPNSPNGPEGHRGFPNNPGHTPGRTQMEHPPGRVPGALPAAPAAPRVNPPSPSPQPPRANPAPAAPPHVRPAPMPPPPQQPAPTRPLPPQGGNAPHVTPVAPPHLAPPAAAPQAPALPGKKH